MIHLLALTVVALSSAAHASAAGFSSVGVAADGTVWVGVWSEGSDAEGLRYGGGLARLSVGRRGARLRAGPVLQGDRVVALGSAALDGNAGAIALLSWQVEGLRPARFAFVDGRGRIREIGEASTCHVATAMTPADGGLRLTCEVDTDAPYLEPGRTDVAWAAPGLTVSGGGPVPSVSASGAGGLTVRLEEPQASDPGLFSALVVVSSDGSEVRLGVEALPRAYR